MQKVKEILIVDLSVKKTSPAGSCVLTEIEGLLKNKNNKITVFSTEIEESLKENLSFVEIKIPKLPNLFRYILFHYKVNKIVKSKSKMLTSNFVVQTTQGQYAYCDISYPHFCHKAYLTLHWPKLNVTGLRAILRKKNHQFNALMEHKAFVNSNLIVVPSTGLANEIATFYPSVKNKIRVISNPVDINYFKKDNIKRIEIRRNLGISDDDIVVAFSALGDFERKGLSLLLEAIAQLKHFKSLKIIVIGGKNSEISAFQLKCELLGISNSVIFVGFQSDIRPYLWSSDLFALPSIYEVFPLVAVQAAAAGLPLLVTKINGVDEYVIHDHNGWYVERNVIDITSKLNDIMNNKYCLKSMGIDAFNSVNKFDYIQFQKRWSDVYNEY